MAETFGRRVSQIAIEKDGRAGARTVIVADLPGLPDGLALDRAGTLFVTCYEPSRILRITPGAAAEVYIEDPTVHTLCHPTNIAFNGAVLYVANLGRWHITRIDTTTTGQPL